MCWNDFFIGSVLVAVFAGAVVCNGIVYIYIYKYILYSRFQRKCRPMKCRESYQYAIMETTGPSLSLRGFGRLGSGLSVISMGMEFFLVVENVTFSTQNSVRYDWP